MKILLDGIISGVTGKSNGPIEGQLVYVRQVGAAGQWSYRWHEADDLVVRETEVELTRDGWEERKDAEARWKERWSGERFPVSGAGIAINLRCKFDASVGDDGSRSKLSRSLVPVASLHTGHWLHTGHSLPSLHPGHSPQSTGSRHGPKLA